MYAVSSFLPGPTLLRVTVGVGSENRSSQNLKFLVKFSQNWLVASVYVKEEVGINAFGQFSVLQT